MMLALPMPRTEDGLGRSLIRHVHISEGSAVKPGTLLLEFVVGADNAMMLDCPPFTHYRLIASEAGHVMRVLVGVGDRIVPGASLAIITTQPGEPESKPVRDMRVSVASSISPSDGL